MPARIQVIEETRSDSIDGGWRLCFQWCEYVYEDGTSQNGYRFIWRRPNGNMQPARGQARIPSVAVLEELVATARRQGWSERTAG